MMKALSLFTGCVALCLLPLFSVTVNAASGSIGSNKAIAKVLKVTPQIDNQWIVAVKDPKSPTGYSVKVKEFLNGYFVKVYFMVFMFTRKSPKHQRELFFYANLCRLWEPKSEYPKDKFMPRQIVDIILPGRDGNCNITDSTVPIKAGGIVDTDPKTNKNVTFPKSSPFELEVNILSMRQIAHPETEYFFQTIFSIGGNGQISGNINGSTSGREGGSVGGGVKIG